MAAEPLKSQGAREERRSFLKHVRKLKKIEGVNSVAGKMLDDLELWILRRQSRYDKAEGGLGKR